MPICWFSSCCTLCCLCEAMKPKLIALDIDGTILDMAEGISVPDAVRDAVNEARANGVRVCLCSSRPCFYMEDALKDLDGIDALIGCSGGAIEVLDEPTESSSENIHGNIHRNIYRNIYRDPMQMPMLRACIEVAKKYGLYVSFAGEDKIIARKKGFVEHGLENDPFFAFLEGDALLGALGGTIVSCAFVYTKPHTPEWAVPREPGLENANVQRSSEYCYIITGEGVDKGAGLMRLAGYWGIPREAVLAIGNDENDVPMLQAAGLGVVVANANPDVFAFADWIAPDVRQGGAAAAIRRFAL